MASANVRLATAIPGLELIPITNDGEAALDAGDFYLEGSIAGIVYEDIAVGEDGLLIIGAPPPGISAPKAGSLAITKGDIVFLDASPLVVNKTTTDRFLGFALETVGMSATHVTITFAPTFPYPAPA